MKTDWQKFRDSFDKFVVQDLKKALKSDVEVGTIILTTIGIECLSGYFVGKPTDPITFKAFIDEFMPKYSNHAITIYKCIRNGPMHNYIIKEFDSKSFLFTRNHGEKHLVPVQGKSGWYDLNREDFALDFLQAQEKFFEQVNNNQKVSKRAIERLQSKGFLDIFSFQTLQCL